MGTTDPTEYVYNATTALLTKVRYTSGQNTYEASCEYDAARRLTKLSDWMNGGDYLLYAYDNADRLTKITDYDDTTLDYTYDYAGNVVTMDDYAGNVVTYTYTDRNQVSTITAPGSKTWTFYYDALGQLNQYYLPNAMNTFYQFDTRNRLTKIWHLDGFTSLDTFTYALDNMSNITKTTNLDGGYWKYWYDLRYQLTKAERYNSADTLLKKFTYTYNTAGNMRTKVVDDSTTYVYAYNKANELTKQTLSGTDTAFAYDAWGRMTSKTQGFYSAAYAYNYHDKLTGVTSNFPNEGNVTYEYGGDGKRHKRQDSSTTTLYNWDAGWNVISEEDNCGTLSKTYIHDPGKAIGTILADVSGTDANGTWRYYFQDNIGSTRRLRDSSKGSLAYYEYEPYGGEYTKYGTDSTRYEFTGKEWDSTAQLYYFPFRYYAPSVARWMTRDPLGMIDGPNLYAYCSGNPVGLVDPLGGSFQDFWEFIQPYVDPRPDIVPVIVIGAWTQYGPMGPRPDHLRHCYASCMITITSGRGTARHASSIKGIIDWFRGRYNLGEPWTQEDAISDICADRIGRNYGSQWLTMSRDWNISRYCRGVCEAHFGLRPQR